MQYDLAQAEKKTATIKVKRVPVPEGGPPDNGFR